ncbi:siderophore biosynthesis PLP-dependent protein [Tumebacillus algifaecis]|uniref:Siderophore biosynthesis PLP-dependent protein n=1 Tax=Tumebacillus algifaecis TaxID=1214604 RepID=A0A223D4U5_9BACL|nr:type III PLP-dependent enzyme [Tumebacillus algifaecis]ASS76453.1 siderophore biosynthesis PLP-dependent protein [Tumebacillus algifaecis]
MKKIVEYINTAKQESDKPFCAFLYDMEHLCTHVQARVQSMPANTRYFYAIKANSELPILAALAPIVDGFEVASIGEVRKVRSVSPDIPIIFGGPGKSDEELIGALEHHVSLIHVESLHELRRLNELCGKRNTVMPILLRVNLRGPLPTATLAMGGRPTQFGIDEGQIAEAIQLAKTLPHVKLEGFHLHSLSNNLHAAEHVKLVQYYIQLIKGWAAEFELTLSTLNAGGGIGVNYADLNDQFDWELFVSELGPMLEAELPEGLTVLFECGRYNTASCGYYAVEVLDIKENHGKTYAIVRGGTQHFRLPVSWQHSHPFVVLPSERWDYAFERKEVNNIPLTVVGQLCTPKDVLASDITVPHLRIGDVILFLYAGAYGWSISHHDFLSHPHPDHLYLE